MSKIELFLIKEGECFEDVNVKANKPPECNGTTVNLNKCILTISLTAGKCNDPQILRNVCDNTSLTCPK